MHGNYQLIYYCLISQKPSSLTVGLYRLSKQSPTLAWTKKNPPKIPQFDEKIPWVKDQRELQ